MRVDPAGWLTFEGRKFRCALGKGGIKPDKREGDGSTPAGRFSLRQLFYRPDRIAAPASRLPRQPLRETDGWCDDPAHSDYNRLVVLPHPARCEELWRKDHVYNLLITLGYNDSPPIAGLGSAIFLHLARPDYAPTEGCVALAKPDFLALLAALPAEAAIEIPAPTH